LLFSYPWIAAIDPARCIGKVTVLLRQLTVAGYPNRRELRKSSRAGEGNRRGSNQAEGPPWWGEVRRLPGPLNQSGFRNRHFWMDQLRMNSVKERSSHGAFTLPVNFR